MRRALSLAAAAALLVGCGSHGAGLQPTAARLPHRALLTIPDLGTLSWQCNGTRFATTFALPPKSATEEIALAVPGRSSRSRTLQPGDSFDGPLTTAVANVWHIAQRTERQTIVAVVRVAPGRTPCPWGLPPTCAEVRSVPTAGGGAGIVTGRQRCTS